MVRNISVLLVLLFTVLTSAFVMAEPANPLEVKISKSVLQYGKPLDLQLFVQKNVIVDLDKLLKPFNASLDFDITNQVENSEHTLSTIRIYPAKPGRLVIPALKLNNFTTPDYQVEVQPAVSKTNQAISVSLNKLKTIPWVREQVKIITTIITSDANIVLERKNIHVSGVESYLIPQATELIQTKGTIAYKHTIGWDVYFLYSQKINLLLPEIEYVKDGVPLYKFHLAKQLFLTKKLPVYVSPVIPVGELKLQLKLLELPFTIMKPSTTSILQYTLTGKGVPAKWLPSLAQQYNTISQPDIQYSHVKTSLDTRVLDNNVVGTKTVDIAFTPLSNGRVQFDKLNLQYFDPDAGMLKQLQYNNIQLIAINGFLQLILIIILVYLVGWLIIKLVNFIKRRVTTYRLLSDCKRGLERSKQPREIKYALTLFSESQYWPGNLTLNQWLAMFELNYIASAYLKDAIDLLNKNLYSNNRLASNNNEIIKLQLLKEIGNLKKKPLDMKRFFNVIYTYRSIV